MRSIIISYGTSSSSKHFYQEKTNHHNSWKEFRSVLHERLARLRFHLIFNINTFCEHQWFLSTDVTKLNLHAHSTVPIRCCESPPRSLHLPYPTAPPIPSTDRLRVRVSRVLHIVGVDVVDDGTDDGRRALTDAGHQRLQPEKLLSSII